MAWKYWERKKKEPRKDAGLSKEKRVNKKETGMNHSLFVWYRQVSKKEASEDHLRVF